MAESMSWWDGQWRLTAELYVYLSDEWREVSECWISDGTQFRRCFAGGASLNSVTVTAPFVDTVDVSWTYVAAVPAEWLMTFEVSDDESTWYTWDTGGDFYVNGAQPVQISLDVFGLTNDDAYVRVSMRRSGSHATGSPITVPPPHSP